MQVYEKPIAELINLTPSEKMMSGWNDDNDSFGDNVDLED